MSLRRIPRPSQGLSAFFRKYNTRRHQSLGMSPEQKYRGGFKMEDAA